MSNSVYKVNVEKLGGGSAGQYIGNPGEVFYDPDDGNLRVSNGLTAGGLSATGNSIMIAADASGGVMQGQAVGAQYTIRKVLIPGGTLVPGSILSVRGLLNFVGGVGGKSLLMYLGGVAIGSTTAETQILSIQFERNFIVSSDLKSMKVWRPNINGYNSLKPELIDSSGGSSSSATLAAITAGASYAQADLTALKNAMSQFSSRMAMAPGQNVGGSRSGVTTYAIDLTVDQLLEIKVQTVQGESAEMVYWEVENKFKTITPTSTYGNKTISFWGDSLTNGVGSSSITGGYVTRLARNNGGLIVNNKGVGGETAQQIRARMLLDKTNGRLTPVVIWVGRNNVGTPNFITDVLAEIATMVANLAPGTPYVIGTVTPTTAENSASASGIAIASLNNQIKALYTTHVADIFAAVATDPGNVPPAAIMSDTTHFNDAGYDLVTATFQTVLVANAMI